MSFLSIMSIIFLGTATFSGLRSTGPDMKLTANAYFSEHSLMDFKMQNPLGIVEDDVAAVNKLDYIDRAEGGWTVDAYLGKGNEKYVIKMHSISKTGMNRPVLVRGEMPVASNECVVELTVLDLFRLDIGDEISIYTEKGTYEGSLAHDKFTITGLVESPLYMSIERGASTIGNGIVTAYIMAPEEAFVMEVYTEMYAIVSGASEFETYGDEYKAYIESTRRSLSEFMEKRADEREAEIQALVGEILEDAERRLADGREQIADGERELANAKVQVATGQDELYKGRIERDSELANYRRQLNDGYQQLMDGEAEVAQGKRDLQASIDENAAAIAQYGNRTVSSLKAEIRQGEADIVDAERRLDNAARELDDAYRRLQSAPAAYRQRYQQDYNNGVADYQQGQRDLEQGRIDLANAKRDIQPILDLGYPDTMTVQQINDAEVGKYQQQINDGEQALRKGWADYNKGLEQYNDRAAQTQQQLNNGANEISSGQRQIEEGLTLLSNAYIELENGELEYLDGLEQLAAISQIKSASYLTDRTLNPGFINFEMDCDRVSALADVFPLIFFLVAALVALTAMTRMVDTRRTEIGAMRALGVSSRSIAATFILYALFASAIGAVGGFFAGSYVMPSIIINAYKAMYTLPTVQLGYYYSHLIFCGVFGTCLVLVATVIGFYSLLKESPARLSQPKAPMAGKRIFLERITFLWKSLPFKAKVMYRNIFRYKKRLFLTIFGIAGTAALVITALGLRDSVNAITGIQYSELNLSDLVVYMGDSSTMEHRSQVTSMIKTYPSVTAMSPAYYMMTSVTGGELVDNSVFYTVPADLDEFGKIVILRERLTHDLIELTDEGCVITEKMAELIECAVGEMIEFEVKGQKVSMPITGICENYAGHFIYITPNTYSRLTSEPLVFNLIYISNSDKESLRELASELLKHEGVPMVFYVDASLRYYEDSIKGISMAVWVIIYAAACLAFAVIYNLNNITITERQRELATLKVIGYYDMDVSAYLYRENALLTLFGIAAGQVLGYLLFKYLVSTIETNLVMFGRQLQFSSMVLAAVLTVIFAIFVNGTAHSRLKKVSMIDALKTTG